MVNATPGVISDLGFRLDFSHIDFSCKNVCTYFCVATISSIWWLVWGALLQRHITVHFSISFSDWCFFIFWTIICPIYPLPWLWGLLTFLFTLCVVLPIAVVWDIVTILGLLLLYLFSIILQLLMYFLALFAQVILSLMQYALVLGQFLLFSVLGLCLHFFLVFYFLGLLLFTSCKRIYRTIFLSFLSFSSKICVVRRPRYQQSASRLQCIDGCTKPLKSTLCTKCTSLLNRSSLLTGTKWVFTRPVEYHRHHSRASLERSAPSCHLCNTLLRSIAEWSSQYGASNSDELTIKLWEKRSIFGRPLLRIQVSDNPESEPLTVEEFHHGIIKPEDNPCELANTEKGAECHRCDISAKTNSPAILEWAKEQITSCRAGNNGHENCQNYFIPGNEHQFFPRRILDVGLNDSSKIRLLETSEMNISGPLDYVALSHCWGNDGSAPTILVQAPESQPQRPSHYFNFSHCSEETRPTSVVGEFDDWKKPIAVGKLSKTIQDAISIMRGIGFRYLWIDSLCIIQNCKADMQEELEKMGLVYANAICTLSATASANPSSGCFFKNDLFLGDCRLRKEEDMSLIATFPGRKETPLAKLFSEKVEQAPLTSRGWTFQERVLASRVLHFCDGAVLFECNKIQASNCHGYGMPYPRKTHVQVDGKLLRKLGPPRPDPPPAPPRPTIRRLPPFPRLPSFPSLSSFSLPSFELPGPRYTRVRRSKIVTLPASYLHPITRPRRQRVRHWVENVPIPNYVPPNYNFARDFRRPEFPTLPDSYNLLDFYNYHESYKAFKEHASWRPQEAEIVDLTDISARIGLRGAFEMLVNFEGKTEKEMMNFHESWYQLVERYSIRNFKREDEDKLSAIVGIAYFIGIKANFKFVAGLWKEVLPFNLLWVLHEDVPKPRPIRSQPTWSWASVNGKISHRPKKRPQHSEPTQFSPLINRNIPRRPKEIFTKPSETEWEEINVLVSNEDMQVVESNFILGLTGHLVEFDHQNVIFFPDVESQGTTSELFCLPILSLKSAHRYGFKHRYQLRGIVLQPDSLGSGMFKRVGYFWTKKRSVERKALESTQGSVRII